MSRLKQQKLLARKTKALNTNNIESLTSICQELAELHTKEGQYVKAIEEYKEILTVLSKQSDKQLDFARIHRLIGEIYSSYLNDTESALKHQKIYLETAVKKKDLIEMQRAYATVGRTYYCAATSDSENVNHDYLHLAYKSYIKSAQLCERDELFKKISKYEKTDMRARLLLNLGLIYEYKGESHKALNYYNQVIKICKGADVFSLLQQTYYTVAQLYIKQKNTELAIQFLNSAFEVALRLSVDREEQMSLILESKADVYIELKNYKSAKQALTECYKLNIPNKTEKDIIERNLKIVALLYYKEKSLLNIKDDDNHSKMKLFEEMGDCMCGLKNYTQAVNYYKKMLESAKKISGDNKKFLSAAYVSLAQTYRDLKDYKTAYEYFEKDLDLMSNNSQEIVESYLNMAELLELLEKPYMQIEALYQKARLEAKKGNSKKLEEKVITKLIVLTNKFKQTDLIEQLQRDKIELGVQSDSDSDTDIQQTPKILSDISLSDISGLSDNETKEEFTVKLRPSRSCQNSKLKFKSNRKGETPLHLACIAGNKTRVKMLLDQGHPVNVRDNSGWLPLHEAAIHGYRDIVEMLLDKDSSLINDQGGSECKGITPLHDACGNGHLAVIELLLSRNASPLIKDDFHRTPLDYLKEFNTENLKIEDRIFFDTLVETMTKSLNKVGKLENQDLIANSSTSSNSSFRLRSPQVTSKKSPNITYSNESSSSFRRSPRKTPKKKSNLEYSSESESGESTIQTPKKKVRPLISENTDSSEFAMSEATMEYKRVMEEMRRKPSTSQKKVRTSSKQKSAYLAPDEIDDNDWLENDVPERQVKKRKILNFAYDAQRPKQTCSSTVTKNNKKSPTKSTNNSSIENTLQIDNDSDFEVTETNRSYDTQSGKRQKFQSTLLHAGFSRQRSNDSIHSVNSGHSFTGSIIEMRSNDSSPSRLNNSCMQSDSTTTPPSLNSVLLNFTPINVHIESKSFRIPIPKQNIQQLTIGWLAEEAAKRYYNKEGAKPKLELETEDKAILDENDSLEIIFSSNANVINIYSTIVSLDLPSITERYLDYCRNLNLLIDLFIKDCLDACQATLRLDLSDLSLTHEQIVPILKALKHQRTLDAINLSGNFFNDETTKVLCKILPTCTNLQSLNLSCNCISWESISHLSELFSKISHQNTLKSLCNFNFSYNNLDTNSIKFFVKIFKHVQLKSLNLTSCAISSDVLLKNPSLKNDFLTFKNVEHLNLSDNTLNRNCLIHFLNSIDSNLIKTINLSGITQDGGATTELIALFRQSIPINIESIDLSRCRVTEYELKELLNCLNNSKKLQFLNLSDNKDLTSISLRLIFQCKFSSLIELILENCPNICVGLSENDIEQMLNDCLANNIKLKIFKLTIEDKLKIELLTKFWKNLWQEKAVIYKSDDYSIEFHCN